MSKEEKTTENDSLQVSPSNSSKLTQDDALSKLEEYRCAICQNIIINACRIDCGHTYCRHCLNVERENRSHGGKPTCFICDAAVTEIIRNAEKDKEIEDLYAILPTDERLRRARIKSERKEEEDNFIKRPKETENNEMHEQSSNDSVGSGDAVSFDNTSSDAWTWENYNENQSEPSTSYGASFRIWQDENGYDDIPPANFGEHNESEEFNGLNREVGFFQLRPRPPPMVIHHTVQHVYHTLEVRNATEEDDDDTRESNITNLRRRPSQQSTEWRHSFDCTSHLPLPIMPIPITSFNHPSSQTNIPPNHSGHYPFSSCRNTNSRFATGYHHQYNPYNYCYHPQHNFHVPIYASAAPPPFRLASYSDNRNHLLFESGDASRDFQRHRHQNLHYHNSHGHSTRDTHVATTAFNEDDSAIESPFHLHVEQNYDTENGNDSEEEITDREDFRNGQTGCSECNGLCEFHQRVLRPLREQRRSNEHICPSNFTRRARSHEMLSPHSNSNSATNFIREPFIRNGEEEECLHNESDHEDHHVFTFRISVPNPRIERNEEEIGCRTSSHEFPDAHTIIRF